MLLILVCPDHDLISIHAPLARGDPDQPQGLRKLGISIHVPIHCRDDC